MQLPTEDRFLMTESELKNKIATLLGGRAAEELIFDEVSTGAHDDLQQGDRHRAQHGQDLRHEPAPGAGQLREGSPSDRCCRSPIETAARGEYSEQTARAIDDEVRRIIDEQRERVADILSRRHKVLLRAAQLLLAKETITGQELRDLMAADDESRAAPATRSVHVGSPSRSV